jgi:hypothetical protein
VFASGLAIAIVMSFGIRGVRADDDADARLQAVPFVFVGGPGDCGPGSPAGSNIVTAAWLGGMGLPDNGGSNTTIADLATNPAKRDPHRGLLLSKNGPTADCSSSGATIQGVAGMPVTPTFELGFDYRNGGHCGAGAPRYNVVTTGTPSFHFVGGCANGVQTPAPQDPIEWTRARFTIAQAFPPLVPGTRIVSVDLIFDEGTDTPTLQDPNGVGLAVVDNLDINGQLIVAGRGIADGPDRGNGDRD